MTQAIDLIVLIDDDKMDNFAHRRLIEKAGFAKEILEFEYADEALEFFKTKDRPVGVIFLDVNMPRMNGFEFLEAYERLPESQRARTVVMMLSTSSSDNDMNAAKNFKSVQAYHSKPLTVELLEQVRQQFLNDGA